MTQYDFGITYKKKKVILVFSEWLSNEIDPEQKTLVQSMAYRAVKEALETEHPLDFITIYNPVLDSERDCTKMVMMTGYRLDDPGYPIDEEGVPLWKSCESLKIYSDHSNFGEWEDSKLWIKIEDHTENDYGYPDTYIATVMFPSEY